MTMETKLMRILATLLMLLAMLLHLPAVAFAQLPGEPIPTGDPLYDRLQQAVLDGHRDELYSGGPIWAGNMVWLWAPSLNAVEAWEPEFGQRSDYWELRAVVAAAANGSRLPDRPTLRRALECADAGPAAARELLGRELRDIRADATLSASDEDARTDELISGYAARFPESRWVYSEAAIHLALYGMDQRWLDMMRRSDSLSASAAVDLYPLSFVRRRMLAGDPVGNPAVAGSILATGSMLSDGGIYEYLTFKDRYKELIAGADVDLMEAMTVLS